jgi:release factor glutamine methyltransferase
MNVADAIRSGEAMGLARLDAQLLLLHALGRSQHDRAWLIAHDTEPLSPAQESAFLMACRRRHAGEPVAYLVGTKEFHGLVLHVDARVLVPRPDTETLVDWALAVIPGHGRHAVIDLGTGSGAIALALKKARPDARVEAVDASPAALEVARNNARALKLDVEFHHGSWLTGIDGRFDLIVGNPPYIPENDPHLAALAHEPRQALQSGSDGLDDIRLIVAQAPAHLNSGGRLLLEHGFDQAARVRALLAAAGFTHVESRRDLAGIERATGGQWVELG